MNQPLPVLFTPRAGRQADEAADWWRENRSKAPNAFSEELERALELIAAEPGVGARARNARLAGVRRVLLHRVRYYLYYRVVEAPERVLQVLAVWHARRGSGRQFSRCPTPPQQLTRPVFGPALPRLVFRN